MPWLGRAIERLLLPAECLLCRRLLAPEHGQGTICDVCRYRWRPVRPPWCPRCGQPGPHFGRCRLCAAWPPALIAVRSAVWLEPGARRAAHALKYEGLGRVAADCARAMTRLLDAPDAATLLVPVPLTPARERARGYNQSARLAAALGAHWAVPVRQDLLVRLRATSTQTALTPEARLANVAGAFQAWNAARAGRTAARREDPEPSIPRPTLMLVDDVFTTGATLAECARTLAAAGWQRITAVTFGRAVIPDFT